MELVTQMLPFLLFTVYGALMIFLIVLALRFVAAQERIAGALEAAAQSLRESAAVRKDGR